MLCAACAAPPSRPPTAAPGSVPGEWPTIAQPQRDEAAGRAPKEAEPVAPPLDPQELLTRARRLEDRGDLEGAKLLYLRALIRTDAGASARVGLARVLTGLGRNEAALETLGEPDTWWLPPAWRLRAHILETLGRPVDAVWALVEALEGSDDEILADELRARIRHLIDGLAPEGLQRLAEECSLCPEGGYARLRMARLHAAEGRFEEARRALEDLAADFVGDPLGRFAAELSRDAAAMGMVQQGLYGLLLPLSGPLQPFGARALRGALLASRLFSDAGDPEIRLAIFDSTGDAPTAVQGVEELARRGVVGIVGPLKGAAAREAAQRARELAVPLLALTPGEDVAGDGAFRLYLREADEVAQLVEYAVEVQGWRRFAILYPDAPAGLRYRDLFRNEVLAVGGEITGEESFPAGTRDVGEPIRKLTKVFHLSRQELRERFIAEERVRLRRERELLSSLGIAEAEASDQDLEKDIDEERLKHFKPKPIVDFDAVFLPVTSLEAAEIAPQFPFHDVEGVVLLGIRSWNYPTLTEVGEEYVTGAIFPAETHSALPGAREFAEAYREAYGEDPGVIEAYAFDAVRLVTGVRAGFGPEDRASLRRHLASLWAEGGVTGPLTSHPGGDIAPAPKLLTVRQGQIVPLEE